MPYVGLQCHDFVTLTDFNHSAARVDADFRRWLAYVDAGDGAARRKRIRAFVDADLGVAAVYGTFCRRFGLCAPSVGPDPRTPWASPGAACARDLWRYENRAYTRWPATKSVKHALRITNEPNCTIKPATRNAPHHNCKDLCYRRNRAEFADIDPPPWTRVVAGATDPGPWRVPYRAGS
jgi:hypothetical protein